MNPFLAYLYAIRRPLAIGLLGGGLRALTDYQQTGKLVPSLVDGAIVAGYSWAGMLGVNGAVAGANTAAAKFAPAPKAP